MPRAAALPLAAAACVPAAFAQAEYRVYTDHPRLFLDAGRLPRLKKETARNSLRWRTLAELAEAGAEFPEKPLLDALLFRLKGSERALESARAWSRALAGKGIDNAAELRLAALVYDWTHDAADPPEQKALRGALAAAMETLLPLANLDVGLIRAGFLAAIAAAGDWEGSESALAQLLGAHWKNEVEGALARGGLVDDGAALIAVLETCHAVRYNLDIDLWERTPAAFQSLAEARLLSYYPFDIDTAEGRARRPAVFGGDEGRARAEAPLYRIAEMLLVAYEANSRAFQFIQGWIRNDSYALRLPSSALYEFVWVNPYLPGLPPQSAPLLVHDKVRGRLFARSGWDDGGMWMGYMGGRLEIAAEGRAEAVSAADRQAPLRFPGAAVVPLRVPAKLTLEPVEGRGSAQTDGVIYWIGLNPGETYAVRINGRRPELMEAGAGGIAVIRGDPNAGKRREIDFGRKLRIEAQPTLKPTDPGRARPTLRRWGPRRGAAGVRGWGLGVRGNRTASVKSELKASGRFLRRGFENK